METLYPKILETVHANRPAVLATLIKRTGSTPREAGTRFVVLEDGSSLGTIGGGLFEARVVEEARAVIRDGAPRRFAFQLTGTDVADTDMLCGGQGEVFLEPVLPGNARHVEIFARALEALGRRGGGRVATALDPERWTGEAPAKAFLEADGHVTGSLLGPQETPPELLAAVRRLPVNKAADVVVLPDAPGGPLEVLVELLAVRPCLYVFGGGHVAGEIVPLAARVGFDVVLIDDRPEFADPARFPDAREVRQASFEDVMAELPVDGASYLVIVTRGHVHDKTVLEQALGTGARYVGMIGSRRKIRIIYDRLREEGVAQEQLDRVHAPIGLDIGAETPEEIAVSIVAELILARAGGGKREKKGGGTHGG